MRMRESVFVSQIDAASDSSETLTIVSYNILADCHVDNDMDLLYTKCEKKDLYIQGRFDAIADEVLAYEPDVICFQEVPPNYFDLNFRPHFKKMGYEGVYIKRVADTHHEGEATFFKSYKYELVKSLAKSLRELLSESLPENNSMTTNAWTYVERPDVTIVCHLRSRATGREFLVTNAHISFVGYKLRDLQALQTCLVMKATTDIALRKKGDDGDHFLPHVVVGDFNQQPTSPGYRILETGNLPKDSIQELQENQHIISVENGDMTNLYDILGDAHFSHASRGLKSAYFEGLKGREPHVTCVDLEQKDPYQTLDYIWYNPSSLELEKIVDVPSAAQMSAEVAFPSERFPSDHLSLCATFRLK